MIPERRKPTTGKVAGFLKIELLPSKSEDQHDTPTPLELQARLLRNRFCVSWPMARTAAELAFARAAT